MNRNMMYNYLKEIGMYPVMHWHTLDKGYHVEFVENHDTDEVIDVIVTDWGCITGVSSIHLCINDIVIVVAKGCKVYLRYKDISDDFKIIMRKQTEEEKFYG